MTTMTIATDPATELESMLLEHGIEDGTITIADDMALVSYQDSYDTVTEVWLHRDSGWRLTGTHRAMV
jgi:hypothetical protein